MLPLITLGFTGAPAVPYNFSNATSRTGVWNPQEGDNGSAWCWCDRQEMRHSLLGQNRVTWQTFSKAGDPAFALYESYLYACGFEDGDNYLGGGISTSSGYDKATNFVTPTGSQLDCGIYCAPPADPLYLRELFMFGRAPDSGIWTASLSLGDGSFPTQSMSLNPQVPFAIKATYISRTACAARFEFRRTGAQSNNYGFIMQGIVLKVPTRVPTTRATIENLRKNGVFGGYYA